MANGEGVLLEGIKLELLTGLNMEPSLYFKYTGSLYFNYEERKDGFSLHFSSEEILAIAEWAESICRYVANKTLDKIDKMEDAG